MSNNIRLIDIYSDYIISLDNISWVYKEDSGDTDNDNFFYYIIIKKGNDELTLIYTTEKERNFIFEELHNKMIKEDTD